MDIGTGIACGSLIIAIMAIILKIIPNRSNGDPYKSNGDPYNKELCKTIHAHLVREIVGLRENIKGLDNKIDELIKLKI